ncbi:MAG: hypothetical protein LBT09_14660, partial [Planctomycetaceae bacterium]|nr:hypothetical protein [Planctomycetaceae bacterium]
MKKSNRKQFLKSAANSVGVVAAGIGASRFIRTLMFALVLSVIVVQNAAADNVIVSENNKVVSLQNESVKVNFDLRDGYYQVVNVKENLICIDKAYAEVNDWKTTDSLVRTYNVVQNDNGKSLLVECTEAGNKKILLQFSLQNDKSYLILSAGLDNISDNTLIIKKIAPVAGAKLFKGKDITKNLRILDGNGGGEPTVIRDKPAIHCRNNMLLFFGDGSEYHSIVLGGITYREFNKSVRLGEVTPPVTPLHQPSPVKNISNDPSLYLYADDAIGKRLDPHTRYLPDG